MCFDASYLKKSCNGCGELLMIVRIGGVRSRLTRRSFHRNKLSFIRNAQGLKRDIDPSNSSRGVDMITGEVWDKSSRRGRE
jgi:hypothetical protein